MKNIFYGFFIIMVAITIRGYTDDNDKCPDNVRFKCEAKFPEKVLVWIAISERGITSNPPFPETKGRANKLTNLFGVFEKKLL